MVTNVHMSGLPDDTAIPPDFHQTFGKPRFIPMRPSDTTPEAWKIQIEIMRRKGPAERFLMACRMSEDVHSWERKQTLGRLGLSDKIPPSAL